MCFWKKQLDLNLKGFCKLVIMCIGNQYAADDGAGPEIGKNLSESVNESNIKNVAVINCYDSPENFTSIVKNEKPTHILIIDICVSGKKPGSIFLVSEKDIKDMDVSTHRIPVGLLSDYLKTETGAKIIILGIEPVSIDKKRFLSNPVRKAINELTDFLSDFLKTSPQ